MRDLHELNLTREGRFRLPPPPTARQLALVEQLVGMPLPPAYVAFLRFSNGGYPERNTFYIEREGQREPWTISNFFWVTSDSLAVEDTEDVLWQYQYTLPADAPRAILPIADNGMGDKILLDLTPEGKGQVVLWVHDEVWPVFWVADSFETFIDGLTTYPGDLEALARTPET